MILIRHLEIHDVSNQSLKLGDIADEARDLYEPSPEEQMQYIGLEHIEKQSLHLGGFGVSSDTQSTKKRFLAGDILFGTLRPYFRKVVRPSFDGVCSTDITVVRAKEGTDQGYLFYFIASPRFIDFASAGSNGTRMPRASWKRLIKTEWEFPDIGRQQKIASVLGAYDDLIENNLRRIKILEEMAQRLYREWFVHFRFPGHENVRMVDSPLREIPEGWEVRKLGEVLTLAYGKGLPERSRKGGNFPVMGSSGVVGNHDAFLVQGPGIVVGRKGNAGMIHWIGRSFWPIDTTFYVQSKLPLSYVYHLLGNQNFLAGDTAVPGLKREAAYQIEVLIPTLDLISSFSDFVMPVVSFSDHLSDVIVSLQQQRDAVLADLI